MRAWSFLFAGLVTVAACANGEQPDFDSGVDEDSGAKTDGGGCVVTGQKRCGSICTDTTKDPNNCGGCGTKCTPGQFCASSKCSNACNSPLKLCGQFCVDTQSDHDNCGKCGMGCAVDRECKAGSCIKKCPQGLTVCDPDCVDTTSDPNNCGSCGTMCGMNESCIGGLCCGTGQTVCNGQCTSILYDKDNCSACGYSCGGNTPYCANGKCVACNPTALVLMDTNTGNGAFITALTNAGIQNTYVSNGAQSYAGSPSPASFGAVVVMSGSLFSDMNAAGQTAIINAHNAGVGLVIDEWALYLKSTYGYYSTLSQAFILTYSSYGTYGTKTLQSTQAHPIWQGLPNSFSINWSTYGINGTLANGGTQIASCTNCSATSGVIVRDAQGSTGRRVYVSVPFNYNSTTWSSDSNVVNLMINSIRWATGCN